MAIRTSWLLPTAAGVLAFLGAAAASAIGPWGTMSTGERHAVERLRQKTEASAQEEVETLFARLCPGRCELVQIRVETQAPKPVGDVAPGFEAVGAGGVYTTEVKRLLVTVLLDSKLPSSFRRSIPRLLQHQLASLAPAVQVRPELLEFPEPQNPPMPPPLPAEAEPEALEPPTPEIEEDPIPEEKPTAGERVVSAVAPWLGPLLMLLVIVAFGVFALKRLGNRLALGKAAPDATADEPAKTPAAPADLDALHTELCESRAIRNRVLRDWLNQDEHAVAALVKLFGADLLADLKRDPRLRPRLMAVSAEVAQNGAPLPDAEVARLAANARARLTAARIIHDDDSLEHYWDFMEGMSVTTLERILSGCTSGERAYVVGRLPLPLRGAFLQQLDESARRELLMDGDLNGITKQQTIDLAARLRRAAEETAHLGDEHAAQATLLGEMVRSLPFVEQAALLEELRHERPEVARILLSDLILDPTYRILPPELLVDALYRTPLPALVAFLATAPDPVREHLIRATPPARRQALEDELALSLPVSQEEGIKARERLGHMLADALRRQGHDLGSLNMRALDAAQMPLE